MKSSKGISAYLSIFMSMTLMLVLSLCLVLIEGCRQNTIRLETECITDIGMNSILAEYHREVFNQYNLFYIDSSYGTNLPSYYNTEAHLRAYMEKNISLQEDMELLSGGIFPQVYMDLLKLEFSQIQITGVSLATDRGGYGIQRQAIQAIQSDIGVGFLEQIMNWMKVTEENQLLDGTLDQSLAEAKAELEKIQGRKPLEENVWVQVEAENPVEEICQIKSTGLLQWAVKDSAKLSSKKVGTDQYVSQRWEKRLLNQGNLLQAGELSFYERLLFQEYLFRYAGSFQKAKENARLDYQLEYLLFGESSDIENLQKAALSICGLREAANLIYLMGATGKREMIKAASSVLGAAIFVPEAAPIFETLLLIGWSCLESIQDTKILMEGGRIPLLKNDSSWNTSLENVFSPKMEDSEGESGLKYEDYLRLFMCFANLDKITYRFMDIIEMDIRQTEGNQFFRMDGCIDYVEAQITADSGYGYTYEIKHAKGYS